MFEEDAYTIERTWRNVVERRRISAKKISTAFTTVGDNMPVSFSYTVDKLDFFSEHL